MNFFAHASVAAEYVSADSALVLGAMLPDFTGMLGLASPTIHDAQLQAGVDFHHHTDAVFHRCPTFCRLLTENTAALLKAGVRRGTARAVSHVGVEILLDGVMARVPQRRTSYRLALTSPDLDELAEMTTWPDDERSRLAPARLGRLRRLLAAREIQEDSWHPELVTSRLERALSGRPRLEIVPEDMASVANWVEGCRPQVSSAAGTLLEEVRLGLDQRLA